MDQGVLFEQVDSGQQNDHECRGGQHRNSDAEEGLHTAGTVDGSSLIQIIGKAEADKQVAITNAEAEAQKTSIAADAQAEANRKIAESLSEPLIEYQKIQKWDGKLPTVSGGNALVSIDPAE